MIETAEISAHTLAQLRRGDLAGATRLTLRGTLDAFPHEILALADTLEVLDLSGTGLRALPDTFCRLHRLRVLFCSNTHFARLPEVLGACPALAQVGFRNVGMTELPADSLPPRLRWLTLTDNRIAHLPAALGDRPLLQKLMLSGNRLTSLPDGMARLDRLELLRLSANHLPALPGWLGRLPRLAWLAWAGNPLEEPETLVPAQAIPWRSLTLEGLLGEGASGTVQAALWQSDHGDVQPVAVKLFRGAMTSDGLPERELQACLAVGDHPALTGALGQVEDHPGGRLGLVMRRLPAHWTALAAPPSLESCTRDIYPERPVFGAGVVRRLATVVAEGCRHLHRGGWSHGDLYAHNLLCDPATGAARLSDFGASARLPKGPGQSAWVRRLDVLAFAILLGELLDRTAPAADIDDLRALQAQCADPDILRRPDFTDIADALL